MKTEVAVTLWGTMTSECVGVASDGEMPEEVFKLTPFGAAMITLDGPQFVSTSNCDPWVEGRAKAASILRDMADALDPQTDKKNLP